MLTGAAIAFALVPTDSLRLVKPQKPLFLYLVPLLRVQVCMQVSVVAKCKLESRKTRLLWSYPLAFSACSLAGLSRSPLLDWQLVSCTHLSRRCRSAVTCTPFPQHVHVRLRCLARTHNHTERLASVTQELLKQMRDWLWTQPGFAGAV